MSDPLAEKFPSHSPYNYCLNDPLNLINDDGLAPNPPNFRKLWNQIKSDFKSDYKQVKSNIGNTISKLDKFLSGKGDKNDTSGGYDFRSNLKKEDDSSGKISKRSGSDTEIVDVTALDAISGFSDKLSNNKTKTLKDIAEKVKGGLGSGGNFDDAVNTTKQIIKESNIEQTKSSTQDSKDDYEVKPDKNTPGNNNWQLKKDLKKDEPRKKTE